MKNKMKKRVHTCIDIYGVQFFVPEVKQNWWSSWVSLSPQHNLKDAEIILERIPSNLEGYISYEK